ncbi:MAG TPA: DUF47 family protein [Nitrososphaeraceae archaeon]|nr:DUF47 family protein [Nitrososphaeraceae archaeon]
MEIQAKRKVLVVLHDEINKILNSVRELSNLTASLINEENDDIKTSLERIRATEDEVENMRKKIIQVAEIDSLMGNREDVLSPAYIINDIAGYISGIAFRLSNMNISVLKKSNFDKDIKTLIDKVVESIFKLNEMARALSINPVNTIELAQEVQKLEREVNAKYRNTIIKAFNETEHTKELLLLKDTVEDIEGMADKCQEASDSFTILALSL